VVTMWQVALDPWILGSFHLQPDREQVWGKLGHVVEMYVCIIRFKTPSIDFQNHQGTLQYCLGSLEAQTKSAFSLLPRSVRKPFPVKLEPISSCPSLVYPFR